MTALQLAALAGSLLGLGLTLVVVYRLPAQPDLATALDRLAPEHSLAPATPPADRQAAPDRVGAWLGRHVSLAPGPQLTRDLRLLGLAEHRFYGQKVLYAVFGLAFPVVLTAGVTAVGLDPPVIVPAAASVLLAAMMSLLPDLNVRTDADAARTELSRALGAYIDLVALERLAGAGPRQAMEAAAGVGDSWPFRRIGEELARSRWSGLPPWDALERLGADIGVDGLADLADIMRLSSEQGAAVYQTLRARSAAIRAALVTDDLAAANRTAERLTLPGAVLALTFAVLLTAPAMFRLVAG